jgi:hypothetical protein
MSDQPNSPAALNSAPIGNVGQPGSSAANAPPVGLISAPIGNVSTEQPGTALFPSSAFEGQDWFGPISQLARGIGSASAKLGEVGEFGQTISQPEPSISADDANKSYGIPGKLTFTSPLPASVAQSMAEAKHDEIARQDAAIRTPAGFWPSAERLGASFVAGALDPLNIASMFVPALGEARVAGILARVGLRGLGDDVLENVAESGAQAIPNIGTRLAVRGVTGAAGGAEFQVPLTALHYGLSRQEQGDYSAMDALGDIMMMGAGLGAVGHVGFGLVHDLLGGLRERFQRTMPADDPVTAEAATRASVAAMISGDPVEVEPVVAAGNAARGDEIRGALESSAAEQQVRTPAEATPAEPATATVPETAPWDQSTPGATPFDPVPNAPKRLNQFLQEPYTIGTGIHQLTIPGGLRDVGGDVSAIIGGPKGRPGLINQNGSHLDAATQRAWDAGYFPEHDQRPEINDLLDKIEKDHSGRPQYSMHDQDAAEAHRTVTEANDGVMRLSNHYGIDPEGLTRDQFYDKIMDHLSLEESESEIASLVPDHEAAYEGFEQAAKEWVAYHGTPHEFNAFDIAHIGTGEGAQAYGHGLYFAEKYGIAKSYSDALSVQPADILDKYLASVERMLNPHDPVIDEAEIKQDLLNHGDPMMRKLGENPSAVEDIAEILRGHDRVDQTYSDAAIAASERIDKLLPPAAGHILTVRIHAKPEEMLDWEKPLYQQSAQVKAALLGFEDGEVTLGQSVSDFLKEEHETGEPAELSRKLYAGGIKGIRYRDASSRNLEPDTVTLDGKPWVYSSEDSRKAEGQAMGMLENMGGDVQRTLTELSARNLPEAKQWLWENQHRVGYVEPEATHNVVMFHHRDVDITHRNGEPVDRTPWNADEFHGTDQSRSLEDLESEHRQEEASAPAQQRDEGDAESRFAGPSEAFGEESGGQIGGTAWDDGRDSAEESQAFDRALEAAHGEPSDEEVASTRMSDAALRDASPDGPTGLPSNLEDSIADVEDQLKRFDAAGLIGPSERAEIKAADDWLTQAKDFGNALLQAASCLIQGNG